LPKPIELKPVEGSTNVAAAGYDAETETLVVRYWKGGCYRWKPIPASAYDALRTAKSAGKFMRVLEGEYGKGTHIEESETI
jgi:hypothetical protein